MEIDPVQKFRSAGKKHNHVPFTVAVLVAVAIAFAGFAFGHLIGAKAGARSVVPFGEGRVTGQGDQSDSVSEDVEFGLFWDVWNLIKDEYVTQPVSDKDLFYGSIKGMVWSLGDPHSAFFDPVLAEEFREELEGTFEGIGAEIGFRDQQLQVIAPLPGTPAERAGLMTGDWILAIDGEETVAMTIEQAVQKIRGEGGTDVVLTIFREGSEGPEDISITRDTILIESVAYEIREDGIAVIEVFFFNDDTSELFREAVQDIATQNVSGVILDLRNNPGGFLNAAVDVASAWVNGDVIAVQKMKDSEIPLTGVGAALLEGLPTVVLVNGGSASGSEIVAGALQDHGAATVVGEQTFGKGSVQDYRELPDGSAVKLTVAKWYTPNDRSIDQEGIVPDEVVEYTEEDFEADIDSQFDRALEILTSE